ncbi:MAG: hypothetical protein KAT06_06515 [Gammaproteobacteria bacterium]|nr:hypothetical protein [Gammaproteobacteria bacterium]
MLKAISLILMLSFISSSIFATEAMKGDNKHVRVWNKFADDSLKLHKKLTDGKKLEVKTSIGSYANVKDFYIEHRYFDKGRLISQVQWEKDDPSILHTIEVFVHNKKGRVVRDFMAAYLPFYHNAPTQTLISIHHYNNELHAFRSFDASGDIVLERCMGKGNNGQSVNILLDEDDLYNDDDNIMSSTDYKQCFAGFTQDKLGKYIIPQ